MVKTNLFFAREPDAMLFASQRYKAKTARWMVIIRIHPQLNFEGIVSPKGDPINAAMRAAEDYYAEALRRMADPQWSATGRLTGESKEQLIQRIFYGALVTQTPVRP